jgi:hypothetical protein
VGTKPEALQISFVTRNARSGGPTSSAAYNDQTQEIASDLSTISLQWNQRLVPLTDALPDGSVDTSVDAFTNGLDGRNLYTNQNATATSDSSYYSTTAGRPTTLYEDVASLATGISDLREDLEDRIENLVTTAAQIAVTDVGSLYTATNVETALAEVMAKVNLVALGGGIDLSNVAQHYIPATDNAWDVGTSAKRVRTFYGYTLNATTAVTSAGTITATGNLRTDGLLHFGGTTNFFPALKNNGAQLEVRLADDSDYGAATCSGLLTYGMVRFGTGVSRPALKNNGSVLEVRTADDSGYGEMSLYDLNLNGDWLFLAAGTTLKWATKSNMTSPSDGNILLTDNAGTSFGLLQFGGTTADYPALKRNGTQLDARYANDSGYVSINASSFYGNNHIRAGAAFSFYWNGRSLMSSPADGDIVFTDTTTSGFNMLILGGPYNDLPALKVNGEDIEIRSGDDSGYVALKARSLSTSWSGATSISSAGGITAGTNSAISWSSKSKVSSVTNGDILLTNSTSTDFNLLQLGGTTNAFPALKRSGGSFTFRLADNSGYANATGGLILGTTGLGTNEDGRVYFSTRSEITSPSNGLMEFRESGGGNYSDVVCSGVHAYGQMWSETLSGLQPSGSTQEVDFSYGNNQMIDLEDASGDVTLTLSNMQPGGHYTLVVTQDSAVARDLVWPGNVQWAGGTPPTVTATGDARDIFELLYDGTFAYGRIYGQDFS